MSDRSPLQKKIDAELARSAWYRKQVELAKITLKKEAYSRYPLEKEEQLANLIANKKKTN